MNLNEYYVGLVFDESGLKFYLLFNKSKNHFYYILNEDGFTPETFIIHDENFSIGKLTGFAFYVQDDANCNVLIAVNGTHVERNHYYDGPFDQLPDYYADETDIKQYMELAYGYTRDNIDKYGTYLDDNGSRVLITRYQVYYSPEELGFIADCENENLPDAEFLSGITPDPNEAE